MRQPGNVLVHADGRFLLADFDVSKDTLGANASGAGAGGLRGPDGAGDGGSGSIPVAAGTGDGSFLGAGGGGSRGAMEAETTRTSLAGTSGFMAPEVRTIYTKYIYLFVYSVYFSLFFRNVSFLVYVGIGEARQERAPLGPLSLYMYVAGCVSDCRSRFRGVLVVGGKGEPQVKYSFHITFHHKLTQRRQRPQKGSKITSET